MPLINPALLSALRMEGVNTPSTMIGVVPGGAPAYAARMTSPTPMAGGFFLVLPIVVGFGWGLASGRALQGALVGLLVGLVLALIVWAVDRRRRG